MSECFKGWAVSMLISLNQWRRSAFFEPVSRGLVCFYFVCGRSTTVWYWIPPVSNSAVVQVLRKQAKFCRLFRDSLRRSRLDRHGQKQTSLLWEFWINKKITEFSASTTTRCFRQRFTQPMTGSISVQQTRRTSRKGYKRIQLCKKTLSGQKTDPTLRSRYSLGSDHFDEASKKIAQRLEKSIPLRSTFAKPDFLESLCMACFQGISP